MAAVDARPSRLRTCGDTRLALKTDVAPAKGLLIYLHFLRAYAPEKSAGQPGHYKILEGTVFAYWFLYGDFNPDFSDIVFSCFGSFAVLSTLSCSSEWPLRTS